MPNTDRNPPPRACWPHACGIVALYLVLATIAATLFAAQARRLGLGGREAAARLVLCLLTVEAIFLAVSVPFLVALALRLTAWRSRTLAVGIPVALVLAISFVVCWLGAHQDLETTRLAWCQAFLLSFAALLVGLTALCACAGFGSTSAQLAATLVALAMLGNVFYANPLIEAAPTPAIRVATIQTVLWTNPWLLAGGTILEADPVRAKRLYSWSVISYYSFSYPVSDLGSVRGPAVATSAYFAAALVLAVLARLVVWARRRRRS